MIESVLTDCIGRRFRAYTRNGDDVEKIFDGVLIEVSSTHESNVAVSRTSSFRMPENKALLSGHTFKKSELELRHQTETLVELLWRGHTRFVFTPK